MKFENPIKEFDWLLGKWEGETENEDGKFESSISFALYGSEIIKYEQSITHEKSSKIIEIGYFFFDKINEKLNNIIINEEGYIEKSLISSSEEKNLFIIRSVFDFGFNLPPNMKIIREIKQTEEEDELEVTIKMGKDEKIISSSIYSRK